MTAKVVTGLIVLRGHMETNLEQAKREFDESLSQEDPVPDIEDSSAETEAPEFWPSINNEAFCGIAGEIAEQATINSEADKIAVLITVLVQASAAFGNSKTLLVGDSKHYARLFAAIAGKSSRARKGTSYDPVKRVFEASEQLSSPSRIPKLIVTPGPLSSGEGLIFAVRDKSEREKDGVPIDPGIEDKRLLVVEGEFGAPLKAMQREGNTLSAILRTAWDHGNLSPLTKNNPIKATKAHIAIIAHITVDELKKLLSQSDATNGFANRFLWVCAKRSKLVAHPKPIPDTVVQTLAKKIRAAVDFANDGVGEIEMDEEANELWVEQYPILTTDKEGLYGSVIARAEAQVLRIAMVYSLLDLSPKIRLVHLKSAIALWDYCEQSAEFLFHTNYVDPQEEKLLKFLNSGSKTKTELIKHFGNGNTRKLDDLLKTAVKKGKVVEDKIKPSSGKPTISYSLK